MNRVYVVVLVALAVAPGCSKKNKSTAKGCNDAAVDKVLAALSSVETGLLPELAGAGIIDACVNPDEPMPAGLAKALEDSSGGPKDSRILSAMKAIMALPTLWSTACVGGLSVPQSIVAVAPDEQAGVLAERCKLSDRGYASDAEVKASSVENSIIAALTYEWLVTAGTDAARSKSLARALLGLH
jgi:hypothetical protein